MNLQGYFGHKLRMPPSAMQNFAHYSAEPDLFDDAMPAEPAWQASQLLAANSERAQKTSTEWAQHPVESFNDWLNRANRGKPMGANSQKVYRSMWLKFIKNAPSGAMSNVEEIERFLQQTSERGAMLVNSLTQQRRYLALLAAVQDELVAAGAIKSNAAREILEIWNADEMGLRRNLPVALNPSQEALVMDRLAAMPTPHWIAKRDVALASLVLGSGLKVHELQKLRIGDVIFSSTEAEGSYIRATTNGMKERRAPLATQHEPLVRRWVQWLKECGLTDHDFVFISHESDGHGHFDPEIDFGLSAWVANRCVESMSAAHIWRVTNTLLRDCGLSDDLTRQGPTVLRNTFAVRQLRNGVPMEKVAMWLGHKDPRSTRVYEPLVTGRAAMQA